MASLTYTYEFDGLTIEAVAVEDGAGGIALTLTVLEGYADINALYWSNGDETQDGDLTEFTKKDSSLNMNGEEGSTHDGETVVWDENLKLSSSGLKDTDYNGDSTYLDAEGDNTLTVHLSDTSLEDLALLGIRATSTSTAEGSIKTIAEGEPGGGDDDNHFPDAGDPGISNVVIFFDDSAGGDLNNDGVVAVKIDNWPGEPHDLDDSFAQLLDYIASQPDTLFTAGASVLGASIKAGPENIYYALDNDPGNVDVPPVDPLPENNQIDHTYEFLDTGILL